MCVWALLVLVLSFSCFSLSFTSSLSHSTCALPATPSSMSTPLRVKTVALPQNEEYCPVAIYNPFTSYEPNVLDDFDNSETSAMILQDVIPATRTWSPRTCDVELDDEIIGKALSTPLFIQEREEPADQRQAYHSHEESLLPAQSFLTRTSTERHVYEPSSDLSQKRKSSREMENERIRILFERQKKSKFSLNSEARFRITNFKPILIEEVSKHWVELLSLSEERLIILYQDVSDPSEINYFSKKNYQNKIGIFVKLVSKVFMWWKY